MTVPIATVGRSDYYKLQEPYRWLDNGSDTPMQVGGHPTEVAQVGYSLRYAISQVAVLDKDPQLAKFLAIMDATLAMAESAIDAVFLTANKRIKEAIDGPAQT